MWVIIGRICAKIDGKSIELGVETYDIEAQDNRFLTLKEMDELKEKGEFDKNYKNVEYRWMNPYCLFEIINNKPSRKIPKVYLDQLEYMGYDISKIENEK